VAHSLAFQLHLSLAREHVRAAVGFYRQAREDAWFLNQDQIDELRDYADDAKRDARTHIAAVFEAMKPRAARRPYRGGGFWLVPLSNDRNTAFQTRSAAEEFYRTDKAAA